MIDLNCVLGCKSILNLHRTAFLCSKGVSPDTVPIISRWAESLDKSSTCVVCGYLMQIEQQLAHKLMWDKVPLLLVLDEPLPRFFPSIFLQAAADGLLAIVSTAVSPDQSLDRLVSARIRNAFMIDNSDDIVVGYLNPNGTIHSQLDGHDNVTILGQDGL